MKYTAKLYEPLKDIYSNRGISNSFDDDNAYLKSAFIDTHNLWLQNYDQIGKIKYLLIAEAPLWGKEKKYFYNPNSNNSQFFYRKDISSVLNIHLNNKLDCIQLFNQLGLLVIDVCPFSLNKDETTINYPTLYEEEYRFIVKRTLPYYFNPLLDLVAKKRVSDLKVFFRYSRVRDVLGDIIQGSLLTNQLITSTTQLECISKQGGGINRDKLHKILAE